MTLLLSSLVELFTFMMIMTNILLIINFEKKNMLKLIVIKIVSGERTLLFTEVTSEYYVGLGLYYYYDFGKPKDL